jgi:Alw26I/Eco31I/Esp3I family type II restriction m6 adenine DNA methyltransferase
MKLELIKPIKALNKAYLKEKVSRNHIELFKKNLQHLLGRINEHESEEHLKNVIADFLKDTWYKEQFEINTKDRNDLVIHTGKTTKEAVGVILEVKKPSNKAEMMSDAKPNTKALQEIILYYLRERVDHNNTDIKYLIVTNIHEWYIMDEVWFEKNVFRNNKLKKDYESWKLSGKDTKFFYDSIAKPFLDEVTEDMPVAYFDVRTYEKYVTNTNKEDDIKLIGLYKILSPAHLLKQPFINDSNSLDTKFYVELLHIIGLEEIKDGSKKLIKRKSKSDEASLLENTIIKLEDKDALRNISNLSVFGANKADQLFNVALELCITWVNRVLFIKLLEAQLYKYQKGNKDYLFLNSKLVHDFDELSNLFFQVLAEKPGSRRHHIQEKFSKVPYLNSSLFERIELERQTINVSELDNRLQLPLSGSTVLKDDRGKRKIGSLPTLQYLFEFLDAYDFTSDGGEEIQEENKNLINASVLGLIFEKINGYKDGSFFTPGFVTMYMCKETIRRSVLQKFNETKGWHCNALSSLYNKIDDKKEANYIINNLHICDPAVGSGHFLVSALNEIIAIKSELKILQDDVGKSLRDYHVEVVNDELIITDEDGKLFDYNPNNKESQRIQETLFHEKETIIENCLFGVDINPNSVKICRLRLWIELLKNAYYTASSNYTELETLPNIDINIKCGNSLISRFALDANLKPALKKSNFTITAYRSAVQTYRQAQSKEEKREMEKLISTIKNDFQTEIGRESKQYKDLAKLEIKYFELYEGKLFDQKISKQEAKARTDMSDLIEKKKIEIDEIKNNKIYENAFEWRFEFPEVLNGDGDFIGFDVVIENPPYAVVEKQRNTTLEPYKDILEYAEISNRYSDVEGGKQNLYRLFIKLACDIANTHSQFGFIVPLTLIGDTSLSQTRKFIIKNIEYGIINCFPQKDNPSKRVFEDAKQSTVIITGTINKQNKNDSNFIVNTYPGKSFNDEHKYYSLSSTNLSLIDKKNYSIPLVSQSEWKLLLKLHMESTPINDIEAIKIRRGEINQTIFRKYITTNNNHCAFIKGVEIGPYRVNQKLSQGKKEYFDESNYLSDGFNNPLKDSVRIATQRITGVDEKLRIVATLISFKSYFADSTNSIHLEGNPDFDIYFILGLFNSNLFQWIFKTTSTNNNVSTTELLSLPFKKNISIDSVISNLVNKLLLSRISNPLEKIDSSLKQIDELVYQLYGLNENEIKIVEQN